MAEIEKNAPRSKYPDRDVTCARYQATLALKRLARRWTTPILLVLMEGPIRFNALERELAPISAKVLATRLRELEGQGLVRREVAVSEPPKTVIYHLTDAGEGLRPILDGLAAWNRAMVARTGR
ncbi:MAG: helix-turn-helix domain-containing protein [Myxococcota bacterium]